MSSISKNYQKIKRKIFDIADKIERSASEIKLITVTKTISVEKIREAISGGANILGENRVLEAQEKINLIGYGVDWHFIGHLQTNKVKNTIKLFNYIHSVDSSYLAQEISKRAQSCNKKINILLQVNISEEKSKFGISKKDIYNLVKEISPLKNIHIKGLMTIPPLSNNPEDSRKYFKELCNIKKKIISLGIEEISMDELSMGMSNDFEIAIEEGATMVRVGSAIFGERKYV